MQDHLRRIASTACASPHVVERASTAIAPDSYKQQRMNTK
jgi:hypothetical protein